MESSKRREKVCGVCRYMKFIITGVVLYIDHVDMSVRKRKAPEIDDLSLQNTAKRTRDNAVEVQEL